jgi:hypothetical protein
MCSTANVGNPPHRGSFSLAVGMPPKGHGLPSQLTEASDRCGATEAVWGGPVNVGYWHLPEGRQELLISAFGVKEDLARHRPCHL